MSRKYSLDEKLAALRILDRHSGDLNVASRETGIPKRTLRAWRDRFGLNPAPVSQMLRLRQELIEQSRYLAASLGQGADATPLEKRATALNQMLDKILKLTEILQDEDHETDEALPVLRIEYLDEQGQVHSSPPGAEDDSEQ
ncbi:MAG: MerR family transcriptional regulator [Chloroflexi bacterium]|nr:MerR family transcriptional regulator [Chloroflexota bacterium]